MDWVLVLNEPVIAESDGVYAHIQPWIATTYV